MKKQAQNCSELPFIPADEYLLKKPKLTHMYRFGFDSPVTLYMKILFDIYKSGRWIVEIQGRSVAFDK